MSDAAKPYPTLPAIHWHEGLFLRPHHLQWSSREAASALRYWQTLGVPGAFGVRRLTFDETAIRKDRFEISSLDAVLADGSLVQYPGNIASLDPVVFKEAMETSRDGNLTMYLCVPRYDDRKANTGGTVRAGAVGAPPRWTFRPQPVRDENTGDREIELDTRLVRATIELRDRTADGYESLPLARVARGSVTEGVSFVDEEFCPPMLAAFTGSMPRRKSEQLLTKLEDKAKGLMGFFGTERSGRAATRAADMDDLLRLQSYLNTRGRVGAILACPDPDPFSLLLEWQGLLATLSALSGEPSLLESPAYDPRDPAPAFSHCFNYIERYLEATRSAEIPLEPLADRGDNTWTIPIKQGWLNNDVAAFCLAIETSMPRERVQEVPRAVKIGTAKRVREYAERALTPLPLEWLPSGPIGARKGLFYFHIQNRQHPAAQQEWKRMCDEGVLALFTKADLGPGTRFYLCVLERGL